MEVVGDFLDIDDFTHLKNTMEGLYFPWFWNPRTTAYDNTPQLIHNFIFKGKVNSPHLNLLEESKLFEKLGSTYIARCKANLNYKTIENNVGSFHTDFFYDSGDSMEGITTSILYINTNNGGTQFSDGTRVKSVANRLVKFDCSQEHASVSCTDEDRRILININYF